jgi:tripartite-type tricarboxylate transporter receptor subunit TctC
MFAPRSTPAPVLKVLRDTARKVVEDAAFKKAMANVDSLVRYMDAPEFNQYWQADAKRLAGLVKLVGKVEAKK